MKTYDKYLGQSAVFIFNSNLLLLGDKMVFGMTEAQIWPVKDEANNTLVWTRHCCVHERGLHLDACLAIRHTCHYHTRAYTTQALSHIVLSVEGNKHCWYFIRNGQYQQEKDEGGDGECARGDNAAECVQMGKGPIHTLTHSWKPDCSSSAEASAYYSNHLK